MEVVDLDQGVQCVVPEGVEVEEGAAGVTVDEVCHDQEVLHQEVEGGLAHSLGIDVIVQDRTAIKNNSFFYV